MPRPAKTKAAARGPASQPRKPPPRQLEAMNYRVEEAAARLGVNVDLLRKMIKLREIGHFRFHGIIQVSQADIDNFLSEKRVLALTSPCARALMSQ